MAYLQASEILVDWHPRSGIGLSTRRNNSNWKVIFQYQLKNSLFTMYYHHFGNNIGLINGWLH
jgi:hypothetical protein